MKPLAIDFFCCQGGCSAGLVAAGFDVLGVDIVPQSRYPFAFVRADAVRDFAALVRVYRPAVVLGSPPCQRWTRAQVIQGREHPALIAPFRERCRESGLPYVIENVEGARDELVDPVMLCGLMFGLRTDRHRLFESNIPLAAPTHPTGPRGAEDHRDMPKTKMGRPFQPGELRQYVGNFQGSDAARADLGVPWMNRDGIRECIPPAYGEHVGRLLMNYAIGAEAIA